MQKEATKKISPKLYEHIEECDHCLRVRRLTGDETAVCIAALRIVLNHPVPPPEGGYAE